MGFGERGRRHVRWGGSTLAAPGAVISTGATGSRLARARAGAEARATAWSARPGIALAGLLGAAAGVAALGIPAGLLVRDDPAAVFREGMPGTWLSCAEFLMVAAAASATHAVAAANTRWHETFWGLSASVFAVLAFVEIAQPTVYLAHWMRDHLGVATPFGLADLDAAILVMMLAAIGLALLVRIRPLLSQPRALALLVVGGSLGVASEALDSTMAATEWEFVAEESLKLAALPFVLAGFLVALSAALRARDDPR